MTSRLCYGNPHFWILFSPLGLGSDDLCHTTASSDWSAGSRAAFRGYEA